MYRVLIADDEQRIRQGMKNIVDWNKFGYKISGEAANGEEALQFMIGKKPDVILLDISMPKLSGLDVIKKAKENGYKGKVIILSSYSNFKFAQEAIRLEVEYYLTKPIDENELEQILTTLNRQLDEESKSRRTAKHYFERAKETIIRDLFLNPSNIAIIDLVDMNTTATKYQVVLYGKYDSQHGGSIYPFDKLLHISNDGNHMFDSIDINNTQAVLLKGDDSISRFADFLNESAYEESLNRAMLTSVFLTYGRPVETLTDIHLSYEDADFLLSRRFFCEQHQHIMGYEQLSQFTDNKATLNNDLLQKYCDEFMKYIQSFNRSMIAESLHKLEEELFNTSCELSDIRYFLTDMYLMIKANINRMYNTITISFPTNSWAMDFIQNRSYLYEIIQFFSEQFELIMSYIGNYSKSSVLEDILHYIDHNYMNNVKLENIAPLFGYNCSYLGKIFKEKTHKSFNSYLDHVRIENSKKLLDPGTLKVYEIAERVGYTNVDYFYMKFKKLVGMSPTDYRKQNKED